MISKKMEELVKNSSVVRAMFEEGKRMEQEFGADQVYDFSLGNPSVRPPKEIAEAICDIVRNEEPLMVHGYMNNSGYEDVREAVAKSLNRRFFTDFHKENIVMTVGAAGGLNVALKTLLNSGDEVIVFAPFFGEYANYVSNFDGSLIVISPNTETFQPNLKELAQKISEKTKAVIINTPNNPSGVIYSEHTIKALAKILYEAQEQFETDIYLISDEPYRELVYDGDEVPYLTKYYKNTIVCYSYSKSLSLPGERIGYLVLPDALSDAEQVIAAANVANRILGFVNAPSLMQRVVARTLDQEADLEEYRKNRDVLYERLTAMGYRMQKPQGAFYLFLQALEPDDVSFVRKAKEFHLLLVPGTSFYCPGFVRLSYCVEYEKIVRSLPAFEGLARAYQK